MEKNTQNKKWLQISIATEILNQSKITITEINEHFTELASIFKGISPKILPDNIKDTSTLYSLIEFSKNLKKLKNCQGFEKHIIKYNNEKEIIHSDFVTLLSGFLVSKVDELIFDPIIRETNKYPDMCIKFNDNETYIECKSIDTKKFNFSDEHNRFFELISKYLVGIPHQISITYKKSLSDNKIEELGKTLQKRAPLVTNEGVIINNENLKVHVIKKEMPPNTGIGVSFFGIEHDIVENCDYPMHIFAVNGLTVSIAGPKVDYASVLLGKVKAGKSQSPINKPYILAIDAREILGSMDENIRVLTTAFQPKQYTRFSGILLVKMSWNLFEKKTDFGFEFVQNPFASTPISEYFSRLFPK